MTWLSVGEPTRYSASRDWEIPENEMLAPADTTNEDSLRNATYKPGRRPTFKLRDRYGDQFNNRTGNSPLLLKKPSNIKMEYQADTAGNVTIYEKAGNVDYRPPTQMNFEQFTKIQDRQVLRNYWRAKAEAADGKSEVSNKRIIPKINAGPLIDRLFGGSYIDFQPNGFVNLNFGGQFQRIDNPSIPVRQQRTGNFVFDQQASVNFQGKVGEKLKITANYDTKASFNFENNIKVQYTAGEEDIIQKLEIGNVSMPLTSTLISGVQNLFGVRTQLKFGRLNVGIIAANQRSRTDGISVKGGVQTKNFEIRVDGYEENKHFFLSQFFRDKYESSLKNLPMITSGVNVTRVEVYITNRTNNTETLRNVVGFADLGEPKPYNKENTLVTIKVPGGPVDNLTNDLFTQVTTTYRAFRDVDKTNATLEGAGGSATDTVGLRKARDFELLRSSRKLSPAEYSFNSQLGYISLTSPLRNDEILAVAYEYSFEGRPYKVGELTEDYSTRTDKEVIALKLLRSSTLRNNTHLPMWNLMMKNIYSLNSNQINREGFQLRIIYKDDLTGVDNPYIQEGLKLKEVPLVQVFGLDRLNPQLDPQVDGNFDYVEGITIDSRYGRVIFPVLEPFGSWIASSNNTAAQRLNPRRFQPDEAPLEEKYVFRTLYRSTQADAAQVAAKNKFFIKGSFQSTSSSEIILPGIGIDETSISVTAGGVPLVAGQDYIVEAQLGRLRIINESVLNSNQEIKINFEKPDLFNNQIKTLLGTRLDFAVSKDINIGATAMRLRERPTLTRISMGNEPVNNTIFGFDVNYKKNSQFLTKLVDLLPFLQTKEVSTITFAGEYAKLIPGVAPLAQSNAFIDDFEGSETPFDLTRQPIKWRLGATPDLAKGAKATDNDVSYAFQRAKLSWYNIDNLFYRGASGRGAPEDITNADMDNHYIRPISQQEIFPYRATQQVQVNETTLDLAYYPSERGPYNYNTDLDENGLLLKANTDNYKNNFGAITRAISYDIDFDNSNVQYIEFWMMDPFLGGTRGAVLDGKNNTPNTTGGKLYFNLGNISEDVMKDGMHAFENGLPTDITDPNQKTKYKDNKWGRVTTQQFLTNAFANTARATQDVGLDGLNDADEASYFKPYLDNIKNVVKGDALARILADPSADNFQYYLGPELTGKKILERYKSYYGMENNSPEVAGNEIYTPASTTIPDNEDLNTDNTISDIESYYQYAIDLMPGKLEKGQGYIVDKVVAEVLDVNKKPDRVTWYQFRIPIREFTSKVNDINGFKSIRFMRMVMTGWSEPVVLRMAQFQMVANQWRAYQGDLTAKAGKETGLELYDERFKVASVNVEENGQALEGKTPYVLPPGFIRDRDISTLNNRAINEQSMKLSMTDLEDGDARAVFKNTSFDFINYKRLKMFVHAEPNGLGTIKDNEVSAFIRVGTDFTENYYEVEVPLKITPFDAVNCKNDAACLERDDTRRIVWPDMNEIDVAFDDLIMAKAERNNLGKSLVTPYTAMSLVNGRFKITVVGNPDISAVQTIMVGMRNPIQKENDDHATKSFTIWVNELRASQFDQEGGYAALGRLNLKLADFANITATGNIQTYGFGGIQQKISERARATTAIWGIAGNVALDKLLPKQLGLRLPMFASYESQTITPRFNPLDPDTRLDISLQKFGDDEERKRNYRSLVVDQTTKRSINFTNIQKVKMKADAKSHFYDIENLSFTYAYSDITRSNINIESYSFKTYKGSLAYTFVNKAKSIEPFKNLKFLDSPYLKLIKDFNFSLAPSSITVRGDLDRQIIRTQLRNGAAGIAGILPTFEKYYTFNRSYDVRWNLTQGLALDYTSTVNSVIDEPIGDINDQEIRPGFTKRDSLRQNFYNLGRMKNFNQRVGATYHVPLDKFPLTDWLAADVTYAAGYIWQASSYGLRDDDTTEFSQKKGFLFGNTIQNTRERGVTGKIDLVKLYSKVSFLKGINSPPPRRPPSRPDPRDSTQKLMPPPKNFTLLKGVVRLLMSLRSINFTYNIQEGTILPGFLPTPRFLGMDSSFSQPGWGFILGSQDGSIREKLANSHLLSHSKNTSLQFTQNRITNLNLQTSLEPFKDFRIQVTAKKSETDEFRTFYRDSTGKGEFGDFSPIRTGSYNISFISIATAFKNSSDPDNSETFVKFQEYRDVIQTRLTRERNPRADTSFNPNSQDVLLGAFLAAYSGKDPKTMNLSPFPAIPLPNWRVDYAGLSRLEGLKKIFSQINITHSYTSTYTVGNYTSSQEYRPENYGSDFIGINQRDYPIPPTHEYNQQGQVIPVYVVTQASITERFSPLIGINIRTQSKITAKLEYNQERSLTLTLNNSQLNEMSNKGLVIGMGYSKSNMKLPIKSQGRTIVLKNQVDFRFDLTIRDTRTIQRTLASRDSAGVSIPGSNTITAGNINFQLKPTINYVVSQRLNVQLYFERTVNEPLITSSYRRSGTSFGVQLRFNLAE
ncbi:MAG: cell surface protein SprA [Bacteroidota bacterium]